MYALHDFNVDFYFGICIGSYEFNAEISAPT